MVGEKDFSSNERRSFEVMGQAGQGERWSIVRGGAGFQ